MTTLLWLQASGCGGCTMSLLCAESPGVLETFEDAGIRLLWHPALSVETGAEALALLQAVESGETPLDILCVEGAIARGPAGTGRFQMLSGTGQSLMHWVTAIAARAPMTREIGSPRKLSRRGRISGMPPQTAASNNKSVEAASAAAKSSGPRLANNALFAVTTGLCLPSDSKIS